MNIQPGSKIRARLGQKVRLVTAVSPCGGWLRWGDRPSWHPVEAFVPAEGEIDHSTTVWW